MIVKKKRNLSAFDHVLNRLHTDLVDPNQMDLHVSEC